MNRTYKYGKDQSHFWYVLSWLHSASKSLMRQRTYQSYTRVAGDRKENCQWKIWDIFNFSIPCLIIMKNGKKKKFRITFFRAHQTQNILKIRCAKDNRSTDITSMWADWHDAHTSCTKYNGLCWGIKLHSLSLFHYKALVFINLPHNTVIPILSQVYIKRDINETDKNSTYFYILSLTWRCQLIFHTR
jgi:hypothetical protein